MEKLRYIYIAVICGLSLASLTSEVSASAQMTHQVQDQAHKDHREGYIHHIQGNYAEAILWYEKSAAVGLAKSEHGIGRILAFDQKARRDYKKALPYIIRAAKPREHHQGQGFAQAQIQAREALDWYCRKGVATFPETHALSKEPACWEGRGKALITGKRGVKRNYAQAELLLGQAVAAGRLSAKRHLDEAQVLNTPKPPKDYAKIAWGIAGALLFVFIMRMLRWRRGLYWLIHKFQ